MKTLKEKYDYNRTQSTPFSRAYCEGVEIYNSYATSTRDEQDFIKTMIDFEKSSAKSGSVRAKGFMCGVRDAANARKNGKK